MLSRKFDRIPDLTFRQLYNHLYRDFTKRQPLQYFNSSFPCVFVLSTGRVGSETLATLYKLANSVLSYHEPTPKLFGLSKLAYENSNDKIARKILREAFLRTRSDHFQYSLSCHRGYVETSPHATFLAPIILECIPNTKFIHVVRNPAAVVRSGMRRKWYNGNNRDSTRLVPLPDSNVTKRWAEFTPFQKNLWLWHETNRWIFEFSSTIPQSQILLVRSEDIFEGKQETIDLLFSFLGSTKPSSKKIQKILRKRLNRQKTGIFPKIDDWTEEMYNELVLITGDTAKMLGYDFK